MLGRREEWVLWHWWSVGVVGLCAGLITRLWPLFFALARCASLAVVFLDYIIADSTSHILFTIELAMYLMLGVGVLLAAVVGRWLRVILKTK